VAACCELSDHVGHRPQIGLIGRPRTLFDRFQPERGTVIAERLNVAIRVLEQRHACLRRRVDGLVVHVSEVHDVTHAIPFLMAQGAAQDVQAEKRTEVPDVTAGVHRQTAGIHPHGLAVSRHERFFSSGQGIEKTHSGQLSPLSQEVGA
jgi:hypothetical protein